MMNDKINKAIQMPVMTRFVVRLQRVIHHMKIIPIGADNRSSKITAQSGITPVCMLF